MSKINILIYYAIKFDFLLTVCSFELELNCGFYLTKLTKSLRNIWWIPSDVCVPWKFVLDRHHVLARKLIDSA